MRPSSGAVYGEYTASVTVQDVGLAGGFATRDAIPIFIIPQPAFADSATDLKSRPLYV